MNSRVICYLLGKICLGAIVMFALPLIVAMWYQESCAWDFVLALFITAVLTFGFKMLAGKTTAKDGTTREWICSVVFGGLLLAGLASLPYILVGVLGPMDAYFESMSGLTTTGVTTITSIAALPKSVLFFRNLTGWFGGIASIVVFIAVLPQFKGSSVYLFNSKADGNGKVRVMPRLLDTAVSLLYIYLVLSILLVVALMLSGMSVKEAINYSCSTISTTGFAIHDSNMAYWENTTVLLMTGFFMLLAGGNFALYFHIQQAGFKVLWKDLEFKVYVIGIVIIATLIGSNIVCINGYHVITGFNDALFQTISFASTTGYTVAYYNDWPTFSKLLMGLLLLIGGCSGSAASGLKIGRVIVLIKILGLELRRILHPQLLLNVAYNKSSLPLATIMNISRFFFVYIFMVVLFSFPLAAAGLPPEEAFFGSASCLSNNGPAFGLLGAVNSYGGLPMLTKFMLCIGMLLGRLEIFIVLSMFRKDFWRGTKHW